MGWLSRGLLLLFLCLPVSAMATELPLWQFGLRGGMDATGSRENYVAGEAYLLRTLPWRAETAVGTWLARIDLGAGALEAADDRGGWLAAGGDLVCLLGDGQVEVEAGFRPVWLLDHRYGDDDFGGGVQFSSHAGIAFHLGRLVLSYRFQHMSNAGIYDQNDGFNLHLFGVGTSF